MSEKITTYQLRELEIPIAMDRDEFYREQIKAFKTTGKPTRACEIVNVILFNSQKEIIVQKRAPSKNHNPYLIDKAVGGHIVFDDNPFYTVMVETIQELKVPSIVLRTDDDFKKTHMLLKNYLDNIAIIKQIDQKILFLDRIISGEKIIIANKVHLFFGIYDGATKPVDQEASGVLYYNLDFLKQEMKNMPNNFTYDLFYFFKHYAKEIDKFLKSF